MHETSKLQFLLEEPLLGPLRRLSRLERRELQRKQTSLNLARDMSAERRRATGHKVLLCRCEECARRRRITIGPQTVFKVEFSFKNIDSEYFSEVLEYYCQLHAIDGYIIFSDKGDVAHGVMEGSSQSLSAVMEWIWEKGENHIDQPLSRNVHFSWLMVASLPTRRRFGELDKVPLHTEYEDSSDSEPHDSESSELQ
ncbi:hypothetical protein KR093_008877 [Drosophila rubida]|uniref:Uncharacterized protein n=1 Tax=Drosophila rubida TaxID=30044 RepID=A0AAD4PNH4_9MUSC|nr:hypothetical protein KR093_008877 [Drosophila rubida]